MDYVLDPELAAVAAAIPKLDLSDLASAREAERLMAGHIPKYEARIPLSVQDITISGQQNAAEVPARVYAPAEPLAPCRRCCICMAASDWPAGNGCSSSRRCPRSSLPSSYSSI